MRKLTFYVLIFALTIVAGFAQTGAKYLVIAHDNFVNAVKPLVDWKTKKGVPAVCVPLSVTGSSSAQIKSYIQNAYNTWNPRPEYILLVGSPDLLPSHNNYDDDYYADMEGNYRIELCIGRFHCATLAQCSLLVAKSIGYEKSETMHDSLWFVKGTTIVREDNPPDPYYQPDARYIHNFWRLAGYTRIDSFINTLGHNQTDVENAITDGRSFVVYRGQGVNYWWSPFNVSPYNTNNGYKLPIVISGTCATMTLTPNEAMLGDAFVRAGTVLAPKGAVAFFGTTGIGSRVSNYRSAVTRGFFQALYQDSIWTLGGATKRAKFLMDSLLPNQTRYLEWNLLGDPELNVWTGKPQKLTVSYDSIIFLRPTNFEVLVRSSGAPVQGALVCVLMDSTVYAYNRTDNNGLVTFSFTPQHIGTLLVTVTAHNFFPYEGSAQVVAGNMPYLGYHHSLINDSPPNGNGNGRINPGERINLIVSIINSGNQEARGVWAILRSSDWYVTINESISNFRNINPGETVSAINPFRFLVAQNCPNLHELNFSLHINDDSNRVWDSPFALNIHAGELHYASCQVADSMPGGNNNGQLGPNETARLRLMILNSGEELTDVYARLRTDSPYLVITDSFGYFGLIGTGGTGSNNDDPFAVSVGPNLPRDYPIPFTVFIRGSGGTYTYLGTITLTLSSEPGQTQDPTGPDAYGYYCYDNTDTNSGQAPIYNWYEIAPPGPGSLIDQITNADAGIDTLTLPFTFRYYGQNYNEVTVSSNGFLACGRTNYRWGYNSPIPDTSGPSAMIAPFWDDLNPNETLHGGNGEIYQYYDAVNHRWIFEFKEVAHYERNSVRETFQVILLDPNYYPTPTGDGEIIFQYHTVADATGCTVGIENQTETDGVQYLFNNGYAPTAAPLNSNRALRFTTFPPITNSPWLTLLSITINDSLGGNNNRIPEPGENIDLIVTLVNRGQGAALNVTAKLRNTDNNAQVFDSLAAFGTIPIQGQGSNENEPYRFRVSPQPTDTILDFSLLINATGYNTLQYFSLGLFGTPGIKENWVGRILNSELSIYPNPFKTQTTIRMPSSIITLSGLQIYDVTGKLVKSFSISAASEIIWDGKDNSGQSLSSGVYFICINSNGFGNRNLVKKITISR